MKTMFLYLLLLPILVSANPKQTPSTIESVTVYLRGAEITRTAEINLVGGRNEIRFTDLSHRIDESSIQVSGLGNVSILAMAYDLDHLNPSTVPPKVSEWQVQIDTLTLQIARWNNSIHGLEEEEKVITTNRLVSTDNQALSLEKVQQISAYYRQRITQIRNEILDTKEKIKRLNEAISQLQRQIQEVNQSPKQETGTVAVTFDAPSAVILSITLKYMVSEAGWVPNYDIKSEALNDELELIYKGNVYQRTGQDWKDVAVVLSTGNPKYNIDKPKLEPHFLNFTSRYQRRSRQATQKQRYAFNPAVKTVSGTITDATGLALPGVNVIIKGTTKGTQTDFDGHYSLDIPYGQELEYRFIGQKNVSQPIYSSIMNLSMEEDLQALEEVVVTAMGSRREKKALGYALTSVTGVSGKVAGVQIRGAGSNKYKTAPAPLYIIDGVPVTGFMDGDLDPQEIQSTRTLTQTEASSLYGSRGNHGVVIIKTKPSSTIEGATKTEFRIKKTYSIASDGDITAVRISTFEVPATYAYYAAPILNENVFLTARFSNWERHQLLPGEANIYFEGTYAGKTVLDPYTTQKDMVLSLGIDPNITVSRTQDRNFKSKSFTGSNRVLERTYTLEVKNNKGVAIKLKLLDRIPKSQHKDIKVSEIVTENADYDAKKGLLEWELDLGPQQRHTEKFSFQVKYPRGRFISL